MAIGVSGCGGDARPTKIVPAQAAATVRTLAQFRATMMTGDGFAVASAMQGVGAQASAIVQPDEQQQVRLAPAIFAVGSCVCDAAGCTFNGCGNDAGTFTVDGTIAVSGDVYTFDVVWTSDSVTGMDEIHQSWTYTGSLTMTGASMDGALSGRGVFDILEDGSTQVSIDWAWDLDFRDVMVDVTGCAIGGSVGVDGEIEESVPGRSLRWAASGAVRFGPACDDAFLE